MAALFLCAAAFHKRTLCLSLLAAAAVAAGTTTALAQTTDPMVHDPVLATEGDMHYLFGTGRGIQVYSSPDLKTWTPAPAVFDAAPTWVAKLLPEFRNHIWAPDIVEHDGTFYLYYSVSAFGRNLSAIGVATNTTLDSNAPDYQWVDHGPVVQSIPGRDMHNAIDPAIAWDDEGTPWMSFGSHWGGLKLCRLADDLRSLHEPQQWRTIAARHRYWKLDERDAGDSANPELDYEELYSKELVELNRSSENGAIEAPFIYRHGEDYFLFVSWDRCCRGVDSTYKVVVGRSASIGGPYLDREGEDLRYGGGSLVVRGMGDTRWAALGHSAAYQIDGTDYFVCHGYDRQAEGRPKLFLRPIEWDEDGWPLVRCDDETTAAP
ncbi:MAG: arabinan endo-1,5-alpha-L-arabinosidase [Planctomycetaceae bacterium]|nr:arabinan endo-1,5-alpha-L-arabinosidase [Planctomycetaceae bacterium]